MKKYGFLFLAVFCLALVGSAFAGLSADTNAGQEKNVNLIWGVKIPMRDGVKLNGTVYKPKDMTGPLPVIFALTPYIGDGVHARGMYFAKNDYVFVAVDSRGRGSSEGVFAPFAQEAHDGYDIVEWLAGQSWSNGKVAMWGGSYVGFDQWSTVKEFPPHLTTIIPVASVHVGIDYPFLKNIFYTYDMQWLTYVSGATGNINLFSEGAFWTDKFMEIYTKHLPYKDLDKVVGNLSTVFQKWIEHPTPDAFWMSMVPSAEQYAKLSLPILTITGHYDDDQPGAMTYYRNHMKYGSAEAKDKHYLIVGPWDHSGTRTAKLEVGGLTFGPKSLMDLNKMNREWYDWTMKGAAKPEFLKKRVAYYVVEKDEWKYADSLETISNGKITYYLDSDGKVSNSFRSGIMSENPPLSKSSPDRFAYDPLDIRPADLEVEAGSNYITDQRAAMNLNGNGVVYHTEPFAEDTEVSGYLRFVAWMALDVPDTDFEVKVYEILRDGTSVQLSGDWMRARYRESLTEEKLVKPGEINRYDFNGFTFFSAPGPEGEPPAASRPLSEFDRYGEKL